jgi:hypothetical protein
VDPADAVILCRFVAACTPAQQWDEYTADMWAEIIPDDFTLEECRAALVAIKRRTQWVDPHDICDEVRRTRRDAAEREESYLLTNDPPAYRARKEAELAEQAARFMQNLDARTGARRLRAVPPPDYNDQSPA